MARNMIRSIAEKVLIMMKQQVPFLLKTSGFL